MMRRWTMVLGIVVCLQAGLAYAGPPAGLTVALEVPHDHVLPGVPFDLTVRVRNNSAAPVAIGAVADLTIRGAAGLHRVSRGQIIVDISFTDSHSQNLYLASHEEGVGVIPWQSWFDEDRAFSTPGDYELTLDITPASAPYLDEGYTVTGPLSASAHVHRITPGAEDAEVWRLLSCGRPAAVSSDVLFNREDLATEVIRKHPQSAYYPYALVLSGQMHNYADIDATSLDGALVRFENSPAFAHLLVVAAMKTLRDAHRAQASGAPPSDVLRLLERASAYNQRALDSHEPAVAMTAAQIKTATDGEIKRAATSADHHS